MIKVSIKLDKRRRLNNGKYPLKYKVARKECALYIPTGYELEEKDWDVKNEKVVNLANKREINIRLSKRVAILNEKIFKLQDEGVLRTYSNKKLLFYLSDKETKEEEKNALFATQLNSFLLSKEKQSTVSIYRYTEKSIKSCCDYDTLRLSDINIDWLEKYKEHLKAKGNSNNTIAMRMRGIRTILNYAIKKGVINSSPFRFYVVRNKETAKRSLTVEQLRVLWKADLPKIRAKHRDIFFLVFFLMGINIVDLSKITAVENGRIKYARSKTGTLYDIKVENEALDIINRYKGHAHLLDVFDKVPNYKTYANNHNLNLRRISKSLGIPNVSTYWARHSFATIAYELGISIDVIAGCLGHKTGHNITEVYIKKDQKKIDEANRKVIDYVLYNKRT